MVTDSIVLSTVTYKIPWVLHNLPSIKSCLIKWWSLTIIEGEQEQVLWRQFIQLIIPITYFVGHKSKQNLNLKLKEIGTHFPFLTNEIAEYYNNKKTF